MTIAHTAAAVNAEPGTSTPERPSERRTHIHVRCAGSWSEQAGLLSRDYVRGHPDDAAQYAELKRTLTGKHREDRVESR